MLCEDGSAFYAEVEEFDWFRVPEGHWLHDNVRPHLQGGDNLLDRATIASLLKGWVSVGDDDPEFWAWYADYDWVVLCQLYGTMRDLPDGWPMFCLDIRQLAHHFGDPPLSEQPESSAHHALVDAFHNRVRFEELRAMTTAQGLHL